MPPAAQKENNYPSCTKEGYNYASQKLTLGLKCLHALVLLPCDLVFQLLEKTQRGAEHGSDQLNSVKARARLESDRFMPMLRLGTSHKNATPDLQKKTDDSCLDRVKNIISKEMAGMTK